MNTYAELRAHLQSVFAKDANTSIDVSELISMCEGILNATNLDPVLRKRLDILLRKNRDDRFICFNIEAAVFGMIVGRQMDDSSYGKILPMDSDINRFLVKTHEFTRATSASDHGDFHIINERKNAYIRKSFELTKATYKALGIPFTESLEVPKDASAKLYFVSSATLVEALFVSKNTRAFAKYGATILRILSIYESIKCSYLKKENKDMKKLIEKKDHTIEKKDEGLRVRKTTIDKFMERLDEMQREAKQDRKQMKTAIHEIKQENKKLNRAQRTMMDKLNDTFELVREIAYQSAVLPSDSKKHTYLGATLSVSKPKDSEDPVYQLYILRRQSKDIATAMRKRLGGDKKNHHVGSSIVIIPPIFTVSPIATVNAFKEKIRARCIDIVDNSEDSDLMVEDVMEPIEVKSSNVINIRKNDHVSVVDMMKMLIDEVKLAQRDSYEGSARWDSLMESNVNNRANFESGIRHEFKNSDVVLDDVDGIIAEVDTIIREKVQLLE